MANVDLSLTIKAIDKATPHLRALTDKLNVMTAPARGLRKDFGELFKASGVGDLTSAFGKVGGAMSRVSDKVSALGVKFAAVGAGAAFALGTIFHSSIEAGDELQTMADRAGMTTDAYASLRYSAAQADVEQEQFNNSMSKFAKNLGAAKAGGGALLEFLNHVAPALGKQVKGAKSVEEAMSIMGKAFVLETNVMKRARLEEAAFGKGGVGMGLWLSQGSKSIEEQRAAFIKLHGSTAVWASLASGLDNILKDNAVAVAGVTHAITTGFFPVLGKMVKFLTEFLVKNRDGLQKWAERTAEAISKWVDGGGFERLVDGLSKVASTVIRVVEWLGPMGTALVTVGVMALPLVAAIGSLGVSLLGLIPALITIGPVISQAFLALVPFLLNFACFAVYAVPFVAAALAVAAAGKAVYDNWDNLVFIFKDWMITLDKAIAKVGGLWEALQPRGMAKIGWNLLTGGPTEDGALTPEARARASRVNAAGARAQANSSEAQVNVSFDNLPRGARVSTPTGSANVSMDVGYSMEPAK